jgi:hypothetical protein
MVEVLLAKSLICFMGICSPALVGERTPVGTFQIEHVVLKDGQDVLMFAPSKPGRIFAIHRPPSPKRAALLAAGAKPPVTLGCVNVSEQTFVQLRACCSKHTLTIRR